MGYYRGDYYRGDYYRGDPFLGSLVKGAAKLIGGGIKRTIGGIKNAGARAGRAAALGSGVALTTRAFQGGAINPPGVQLPGGVTIHPGSLFPGGDPAFELTRNLIARMAKKRRRMNPLNPKALRRALRRAEGFERFATRTVNALYSRVDGRKTRNFKRGCR